MSGKITINATMSGIWFVGYVLYITLTQATFDTITFLVVLCVLFVIDTLAKHIWKD